MRAAFCTAYGPPEVLQIRTVPDPSPRNKEVCIRLVATAVTASDCIVDLIFDAVGKRKSAKAMLNAGAALASGGVSMSVDDAFPRTERSDLLVLKELAESGALRSVIDRRYTLDEIVEAHRYVDLGHKKGNVIVTISPG